jgi:hypothetical protein
MRLILNDPQTDDDDEWGRTEQIALRQLTDEAITVRKALFGWSSVDGLLDKWDYFETNHFDIDYTTPADSTLTIGNTVLSEGQLNLGNTNFFTSSEFSMNGGYFFIEKTGDLAMRIVGGDNDGGAGDVVINMLPAPVVASNSAAAITFVINNQTYSFSGSSFALPSGSTLFADSASYSGNIAGVNMTLSGTLTVGTTSTTIDTDSIVISDVATINSSGLNLEGAFDVGVGGDRATMIIAGGPSIIGDTPIGGNNVLYLRGNNLELYSTRSSEAVCSIVGATGTSAAVAWKAASYVVDTDSFNITWNTGTTGENLLIDFNNDIIRLKFRQNAIESTLTWDPTVYAYSWTNIDNLSLSAVSTGYDIFLVPSTPRIALAGKAISGAVSLSGFMELGDTGVGSIHGMYFSPSVSSAQTDEGVSLINYNFFIADSTSSTVLKTSVAADQINFEFRTSGGSDVSLLSFDGSLLGFTSTGSGERFRVGSANKSVSLNLEDITGIILRDGVSLSPLDIGINFESANYGSGVYGFAFTDQSVSGAPKIIVEDMPFYILNSSQTPTIRLDADSGIATEKEDYLKWVVITGSDTVPASGAVTLFPTSVQEVDPSRIRAISASVYVASANTAYGPGDNSYRVHYGEVVPDEIVFDFESGHDVTQASATFSVTIWYD